MSSTLTLLFVPFFAFSSGFAKNLQENKSLAHITPSTTELAITKDLSKLDFQFSQGKEALEAGRTREALHYFGNVLEQHPEDTEAWEMMALTLRKRGEYLKALRIYFYLSSNKGELGTKVLSQEEQNAWNNIQALYGGEVYPKKEEVQYLYDIAMTFYEYGVHQPQLSTERKEQVLFWAEKYLNICERLQYRTASIDYLRGLLAQARNQEVSAGHYFYQSFKNSQHDPELSPKAEGDYQLLAGHKFTLEGRPDLSAHFYRDLQYNEEAFHESRYLAQFTNQDLAKSGPNFALATGFEKVENIHGLDKNERSEFGSNPVNQNIFKKNDGVAKVFESRVIYLSDPTDWMVARAGFIIKNYDYGEKEMKEFDQKSWGITGRFDFSISRHLNFLLNGDYQNSNGKFYRAGIVYNNRDKWGLSPGIKWMGDAGVYSISMPISNQVLGGQLQSNNTTAGVKFVSDFYSVSEWCSPMAFAEYNQYIQNDYAGSGHQWGLGFENQGRPNSRTFFTPFINWKVKTRELADSNQREWDFGAKFLIIPWLQFDRWQIQLSYQQHHLDWGRDFEHQSKQSTYSLSTLVFF